MSYTNSDLRSLTSIIEQCVAAWLRNCSAAKFLPNIPTYYELFSLLKFRWSFCANFSDNIFWFILSAKFCSTCCDTFSLKFLCEFGKENGFDTIITVQPILGSSNKMFTNQEWMEFRHHVYQEPHIELLKKYGSVRKVLNNI